jgi:hypothetical protein
LAASGIIRSLFGAAFPLFTVQMYRNLGIHWASMIPAFLSLVCAIFPFMLYKYGATIRKKCKYSAQADAFMEQMRARAAAQAQGASAAQSENSSRTALGVEDEVVQDAFGGQTEPHFEEMKTGQEAHNGLEKVNTARTHRSSRRGSNVEDYEVNPYDIDRVNTRESFTPGMRRTDTSASGRAKR